MPRFTHPLQALRHHVSGAIERGEAAAIVEQRAPTIEFSCKSVVGGWQTLITIGAYEALIGPVFNSCTDLWAWQALNLPKIN